MEKNIGPFWLPAIEFLLHALPAWTEARLDLFFGPDAPEDLGQHSFDQYIKWGQPKSQSRLLEKYRQMLRSAVEREVERSLDFLLISMLIETPGYSVTHNIDFLKQHPSLLSKSGRTIARLVNETDSPPKHITIAEKFWRVALKTGSPLEGFGWFAEVKTLNDETWAELTLQTFKNSSDHVEWGKGVIERLMAMSPTETNLEIARRLLQGPSNEWERIIIAKQAPDFLLSAQHLDKTDEYRRLQTALREHR